MVIILLSQGAIGEIGAEGAAGNDGARVSNSQIILQILHIIYTVLVSLT